LCNLEAKIQRLYLAACPIVLSTDSWTGLWGANSETGPRGRFLFIGKEFPLVVQRQLNTCAIWEQRSKDLIGLLIKRRIHRNVSDIEDDDGHKEKIMNKFRMMSVLMILAMLFLLTIACGIGDLSSLLITPTSVLTATPAVTATPTRVPIPLPSISISSGSASRITELVRWGKGTINKLAYSPDGKMLAVASSDRNVVNNAFHRNQYMDKRSGFLPRWDNAGFSERHCNSDIARLRLDTFANP